MAQVQCPNCGGYKTTSKAHLELALGEERPTGCGDRVALTIFTIGLLGLPLLMKEARAAVLEGKRREGSIVPVYYENTCHLCGYAWTWTVGTPMPTIQMRPDLIAKGEQRLAAEEAAYQDRVAHEMAENALHGPPPR